MEEVFFHGAWRKTYVDENGITKLVPFGTAPVKDAYWKIERVEPKQEEQDGKDSL